MKRVLNLSLFVCTILFGTTVKATDILSVKIENSSTINVSLSGTSKGQKLYIKDYSGVVLFDVTLDAMHSYNKYFDLKTVNNGVYFIETETAHDVKVTPVIKDNSGVALIENSTITIFKPKVHVDNAIVNVMLTRPGKSPLDISIYDQDGNELLKEKFEDDTFIFKRAYNFSDVPSGLYSLYFSIKGRTFVKDISI